MKKLVGLCALVTGMAFSNAHAVMLQVDATSGILTGATGVNVGGHLYDVAFMEGTCADVFGVCDPSHFTFTTNTSASVAAQALLDQVLIDSALGLFDSTPGLTLGCDPLATACNMITPFELTTSNSNPVVGGSFAQNHFNEEGDFPHYGQLGVSDDSSLNTGLTWAVWSASTVDVPEPGTLMLLGAGLFSLAATRGRKRSTRQLTD